MDAGFLEDLGDWMTKTGPLGDVVFSSRARLARNLDRFNFTPWASDEDKKAVSSMLQLATRQCASLTGSQWLDLKSVDDLTRRLLVERHLISIEQCEQVDEKAVVIDRSQCISLMVNEEDHVRLQTLQPGLALYEAWRLASAIDDELESLLPYAFSDQLGYLTACPSNVGTGMRVSVLMHLAGLAQLKQMGQVLNASAKLGLAVRGFYGEGSQSMGNLVQLSNQATLGLKEDDILENLETRVKQIVSHERDARRHLFDRQRSEMEDRVWRAYGILTCARMISSQEAMDLLSDLRLGMEFGVLPEIKAAALNELMMWIQPAHLQSRTGKELQPEERDIARAELIRSRLTS